MTQIFQKAKELDSHIIIDDTFRDWEYRFLGINQAFTCADILSGMIIQQCMVFDDFETNFIGIIPP